MRIHKGITLKFFSLMLLFLIIFISILVYIQIFVVSRLYLTTESTKQIEETLYVQLDDFRKKYSFLSFLDDTLKNSDHSKEILENVENFEKTSHTYIVIFDKDYETKYISKGGMGALWNTYLQSISNSLRNNIVKRNQKLSFRVKGIFNLPTKYIAVSIPVYLNDKFEYVVAVTPEVYSNQNKIILKQYFIYTLVASILLAIIISGIISFIITRPILKINKIATKMTDMDFTEKCIIKSNDELGNLANSLNFLSGKLDATLKQLYNANEKLQKDLDLQKELDLLKKDFIAAVSHEFKTPLTLIRGYTEGIKDNIIYENEKDLALDTIIKEVGKTDKLVQDLLDLSSMESVGYKLELSEFYIDKLLEIISSKYEHLIIEKKLMFVKELKCEDILVKADSFRIEQVITNFLNNAIANTETGKTITLLSEKQKDSVYISVENQGLHIPEDDITRIWEKFYRIEKSRSKKSGGTGLGLAICKTILENHSCTFGVENTKCGVKFYFYLKT